MNQVNKTPGEHSPDSTSTPAKPERLLRLPEARKRLGVGRTFFLDRVRSGQFPRPIKLGERVAVWPESQIDALVERLASGQGMATAGADHA